KGAREPRRRLWPHLNRLQHPQHAPARPSALAAGGLQVQPVTPWEAVLVACAVWAWSWQDSRRDTGKALSRELGRALILRRRAPQRRGWSERKCHVVNVPLPLSMSVATYFGERVRERLLPLLQYVQRETVENLPPRRAQMGVRKTDLTEKQAKRRAIKRA